MMKMIYNFFFSFKKIQVPKNLPTWVFVAPKCWQNFEILQLVWTLTPNKSWTKCLRCLISMQAAVFHPHFRKTTILISIWLQLNHNCSSNLLKKLSKLNFFLQFSATIWILKKYIINLHHFVEYYEARKGKEHVWSKKWSITA